MNNLSIFFNPFVKYTEKQLIIVGAFFMAIGSVLAFFFNARFDGVFDLHFVANVSIAKPVIDNLIAISCVTLLLFIPGIYINRKTRLVDIFAAAVVCRIPLYLLTLFNINGIQYDIADRMLLKMQPGTIDDISSLDLGLLLIFALFALLFLIWMVIILYNGFKTAVNAKGILPVILFIISILLAELLSKALLTLNIFL